MSPRQFNLADLFEIVVDTVPDRLALVAGSGGSPTGNSTSGPTGFAHFLDDRGIDAGAHVGILAYNCAEWAEAMIGCYKARTVPVNLNYRYVASELTLRDRQRRPRGARVRACPVPAGGRVTRSTDPGDAPSSWWRSTTGPPGPTLTGRRGRLRGRVGLGSARARSSLPAPPTTSMCSTPEEPPGCPKG